MDRPGHVYRREVDWVSGGQRPTDMTFDLAEWDRWVDELSEMTARQTIAEVRLLAAPINWGHDLAPQLLRIMERRRDAEG